MIGTLATIDDERIDQKLYKRLIAKTGLVETHLTFYDGPSALEFLAVNGQDPIDVILLDINMPNMSGFEFLDAAHERFGEGFAKIAVMMLSTSVAPKDKARAARYDVVKGYFNKPLASDQIQQIDAWLNCD